MRRARSAPAPPAPLPPLRLPDLLFVNEYLKPELGLDATAAYKRLRPHVKYETAASQACRLLKKPQVQAELARRMAAVGVTKQYLEASLLTYKAWAEAKQDYVAGASICMDAGRLAGLITDKREVHTVGDSEQQIVRSLVDRCLRPSAATGTPLTPQPVSDAAPSLPSVPSSPPSASEPASRPTDDNGDSAHGH